MDRDEELHLAAAGYANRRKQAYKEAMARGHANHMTDDELNGRWLAHYEGYREGYWAATGDARFSTDPAKEKSNGS